MSELFSCLRRCSTRDDNACGVLSSVAAGDTTECHDVSHSVSAETVAAVDTAGNFTSSEETRDNVALVVQNLSFSVDSQTAHCVVDSRSNHNCVVRSFGQRTRHIGTAELSVFLVSLELGVVSQSGFQVVSVDAEFLSEFFRCLAFSNETLLDVCFDGFQALANAVIEEEVADFVSLLQFGSRNDVTSLEFVDEAFAFFVDEDSAVAANSFSESESVSCQQ